MTSANDVLIAIRRDYFRDEGSAEIDGVAAARVFADCVADLATDDFTVIMDGGAMTTTYEGREGMLAGWSDFLAPFETIRIRPEEVLEAPGGECAVEFVRLNGQPRGTSAEIEHEAAAVWRVREGLVRQVEFHMSRQAALRSAGIEPGTESDAPLGSNRAT